ncbi:MAG: pyridoxal phosphate-dependent aminotransferase [Granulosicoccus sp.]
MKFSSLTTRIQEKSEATEGVHIDPWAVHTMATERVSAGDKVTLLSIGQEVHEVTPRLIVDTAVESLRSGRHHYVDVSGELRLRSAIASYHQRLTSQSVTESMVTVFAGAQNALFSVAQVLLEQGDEVILVAPYYTTYQATFGAPGPTVVTVQVEAANGYQLDEQKILDAITDGTRAVVLNAPNNPLGSRYSQAQLKTIVEACVKRRIWVILDAVYLDIVAPDSIDLPHELPGAEDILITIGSLSKSHRMTGWRMGWAIGPEALAEHLRNLSVCMHYGLAPFIQDAAIAAIEQSTRTPETVRNIMNERRQLAIGQLHNPEPARLIDPGQGMFILLDIEALNTTAFDFAVALLERMDVSVLPCDGFGPGGRYLVRIGLCVDGEELESACKRIMQFIQRYV